MDVLFPGEAAPLPGGPDRITVTWTMPIGEHESPREVKHASGYEPFVQLSADYGTHAQDLFDLWRFAHFLRAHAAAFRADAELQHAAVVFLGNSLIAAHPDLSWRRTSQGLVAEASEPVVDRIGDQPIDDPAHRRAPVQRIVEALLEADEQRFHEFHPTVEQWRPRTTS